MKLDEARIVLRPRSTPEILDLALRVMTGPAMGLNAKLGLLVLVPLWGLTLGARWGLGWDWPLVWGLALGLCTLAQGVFTVAVGRMMFAEEPGAGETLVHFGRRLPAYLVVLVLTRLALGLSGLLIMFVLPVLWVWGRCVYVHEACLLEQAGPLAALGRASSLVARSTLSAAVLMLVLSATVGAFLYVAEAALNVGLLEFVLQVGQPFGSLSEDGGSAAALLGLFLAVPYWSTVRFLAYVDARTRSDGWDIQLRFMALAREQREEVDA